MNQFLIANAQRCIGCRTCEVACAVAHQQAQDVAALSTNHFAPRIRVVKSGDISTAMACRQCEDAPCASVCPQGAIQRDNDACPTQALRVMVPAELEALCAQKRQRLALA